MTTYSKETALYDTGAIGDGITEAGQTAERYVTAVDSNGIKVHAENNASSNYSLINANGMTVYKGGEDVASFGEIARVGKTTEAHTEILEDMFYIKNAKQVPMFNVASSSASVTSRAVIHGETSVGSATETLSDTPISGTQMEVWYEYESQSGSWSQTFIVTFTAGTSETKSASPITLVYDGNKQITMTSSYTNKGVHLVAIYYNVSSPAPKMAFGDSADNNGAYSASFGQGTEARSGDQFVVGKYNELDLADQYHFIVGDGANASSRQNAFAVGKDHSTRVNGSLYVIGNSHLDGYLEIDNSLSVNSDITSTGSLTIENHSSAVGTMNSAANTKSISTGTSYVTSGLSFSLTAGTYILVGEAEFASNSTGRRGLVWQQSGTLAHTEVNQMAVSGVVTRVQSVCIAQPSSTLTYTLYAVQNSGSSLSTKFSARYVRIA